MISIVSATEDDIPCLCDLSRQTFLESHGNSAPQEDLNRYMLENFTEDKVKSELRDPANRYHLLYYYGDLVGFSKIIMNVPYKEGTDKNVAKLNRIFLLKKVYDLKLGARLLTFNLNLAKENHQAGVWLFTWIENERAIRFYKRNGFKIIGTHDFKISETHTNPNYLMFLDLADFHPKDISSDIL